jgi:hypothetical protein
MLASDCEAMSPESYLNPDLFKTGWDTPELDKQQYAEGLKQAEGLQYLTIGYNGCWGGFTKNCGSLTSYERIGYHASTAALLKGFLDSGIPIFVYRWEHGQPITQVKIK